MSQLKKVVRYIAEGVNTKSFIRTLSLTMTIGYALFTIACIWIAPNQTLLWGTATLVYALVTVRLWLGTRTWNV